MRVRYWRINDLHRLSPPPSRSPHLRPRPRPRPRRNKSTNASKNKIKNTPSHPQTKKCNPFSQRRMRAWETRQERNKKTALLRTTFQSHSQTQRNPPQYGRVKKLAEISGFGGLRSLPVRRRVSATSHKRFGATTAAAAAVGVFGAWTCHSASTSLLHHASVLSCVRVCCLVHVVVCFICCKDRSLLYIALYYTSKACASGNRTRTTIGRGGAGPLTSAALSICISMYFYCSTCICSCKPGK